MYTAALDRLLQQITTESLPAEVVAAARAITSPAPRRGWRRLIPTDRAALVADLLRMIDRHRSECHTSVLQAADDLTETMAGRLPHRA